MPASNPYGLKSPCRDCPFRRDVPGFLTRARAEEIGEAVLGGLGFSCHKTVDYTDAEMEDEEGCHVSGENEMQCAGALIFLDKQNLLGHSQMHRIAMRLRIFNPDALNMDAPVFDSLREMVEHHGVR